MDQSSPTDADQTAWSDNLDERTGVVLNVFGDRRHSGCRSQGLTLTLLLSPEREKAALVEVPQ